MEIPVFRRRLVCRVDGFGQRPAGPMRRAMRQGKIVLQPACLSVPAVIDLGVTVVAFEQPDRLTHRRHVAVVEQNETAFFEHPVDEVYLKCQVIECLPAVHEEKIEFFARQKQLGHDPVAVFPQQAVLAFRAGVPQQFPPAQHVFFRIEADGRQLAVILRKSGMHIESGAAGMKPHFQTYSGAGRTDQRVNQVAFVRRTERAAGGARSLDRLPDRSRFDQRVIAKKFRNKTFQTKFSSVRENFILGAGGQDH